MYTYTHACIHMHIHTYRWSSALHLAIQACAKPGEVGQKSVDIVRMFVESLHVLGLDVNGQDIDGRTPMHEACGVGDRCMDVMDMLLEVGKCVHMYVHMCVSACVCACV